MQHSFATMTDSSAYSRIFGTRSTGKPKDIVLPKVNAELPIGKPLGLRINNETNEIVELKDGFAAQRAGIRCGDVVVSVDGRETIGSNTARDALKLSPGKGQCVRVLILERKSSESATNSCLCGRGSHDMSGNDRGVGSLLHSMVGFEKHAQLYELAEPPSSVQLTSAEEGTAMINSQHHRLSSATSAEEGDAAAPGRFPRPTQGVGLKRHASMGPQEIVMETAEGSASLMLYLRFSRDANDSLGFNVSQSTGNIVNAIKPSGTAEEAGLCVGDTILKVNGRSLNPDSGTDCTLTRPHESPPSTHHPHRPSSAQPIPCPMPSYLTSALYCPALGACSIHPTHSILCFHPTHPPAPTPLYPLLPSLFILCFHPVSLQLVPYTIPYHTHPTTPHHTTPHHITSSHTIACHAIPHHTIPHYTIPHHTTPYHTIPHHTTTHDATP